MWGFRRNLPLFVLLNFSQSLLASISHAEIPHHELSFDFRGFSGNSGGVPTLGLGYRYKHFEVTVLSTNQEWLLFGAFRKNFNEQGIFVPFALAGLALPNVFPLIGLGLEILTPPISFIFKAARYGIRLDTEAFIPVLAGSLSVTSYVTMGATCHF